MFPAPEFAHWFDRHARPPCTATGCIHRAGLGDQGNGPGSLMCGADPSRVHGLERIDFGIDIFGRWGIEVHAADGTLLEGCGGAFGPVLYPPHGV